MAMLLRDRLGGRSLCFDPLDLLGFSGLSCKSCGGVLPLPQVGGRRETPRDWAETLCQLNIPAAGLAEVHKGEFSNCSTTHCPFTGTCASETPWEAQHL